MTLIDTHSHLFLEEFSSDLDTVIQRAVQNQVTHIILPNIDQSTVNQLLSVCKQFKEYCHPLMGLHPTSVDESYKHQLAVIEPYFDTHKIIGVGEIGIDLYWSVKHKAEQTEAFRSQLQWSKELNLPAIIHIRQSFDEVVSIVKEEQDGRLKGIFHCFGGSVEQAKTAIDLGFKLGIGGVVTYKNGGLDIVLPQIPITELVLETDAPYLTPVPYRCKRNESAYLSIIAQKIAEIYTISLEEVANTTTRTAKTLFSI